MSVGVDHVVVVTTSSEIASWGLNKSGQLGQNNDREVRLPTVARNLEVDDKSHECDSD